MAESEQLILPSLREMRAEIKSRFDQVGLNSSERFARLDRRFDKLEVQVGTVRQALTADPLLSKLLTAEFEERIERLQQKVRELEDSK